MFGNPRRSMIVALATALLSLGPIEDRASSQELRGLLETNEEKTIAGRLVDRDSEFIFEPEEEESRIPLEEALAIRFEGTGPDHSAGTPHFRVLLGPFGQLSGRLVELDKKRIHLDGHYPGQEGWTIDRRGTRALTQWPDELQVFRDRFEAIDESRWVTQIGSPELATEPTWIGEQSLQLPANGSALVAQLAEPIRSGRLELAFFDDERVVSGQNWLVELTFQNREAEPVMIRARLGWSKKTQVAESVGGPKLAVQPLVRRPGWHRLSARFGPGETHLDIDGDELAHGPGPGGSLVAIRLATESDDGEVAPPPDLFAILDDLSLVRFIEPSLTLEVEPQLDEIRLGGGDQLFGHVNRADAEGIDAEVDGQMVALPWTEVAALAFQRSPASSKPIAGSWVRLSWWSGPGRQPKDLDQVEGVITSLSDDSLTLEVPFVGLLGVPHDRLQRLEPIGRSQRIVIDPSVHHLGDRLAEDLDPPQPEPEPLIIDFELDDPPEGATFLAIDVVQAIGETGTPVYSELVRQGHLRTQIFLNDQQLEDLNRFIQSSNKTPERIRVPIPNGWLQKGRNSVRFEQIGTAEEPKKRDNLGLLGLAIETALDESSP